MCSVASVWLCCTWASWSETYAWEGWSLPTISVPQPWTLHARPTKTYASSTGVHPFLHLVTEKRGFIFLWLIGKEKTCVRLRGWLCVKDKGQTWCWSCSGNSAWSGLEPLDSLFSGSSRTVIDSHGQSWQSWSRCNPATVISFSSSVPVWVKFRQKYWFGSGSVRHPGYSGCALVLARFHTGQVTAIHKARKTCII